MKRYLPWFVLSFFTSMAIASVGRPQALPESYDLRNELPSLTPVKDQGVSGSCLSDAPVFAMEVAIQKAEKSTPVVLSDSYVLTCGVDGGSGSIPYSLFITPGVVRDIDWVKTNSAKDCATAKIYRRANGYQTIGSLHDQDSNVESIKQAILDHGAVVAEMGATPGFVNYSKGIFRDCESSPEINHAVTLIGWDDQGGYWIGRNSWGAVWGESGYFRIQYGCNGIDSYGSYLIY